MKRLVLQISIIAAVFTSCSNDDDVLNPISEVKAPLTYAFEREGESTVNFEGQTTRIEMASEYVSALLSENRTEAELDAMFAHVEGEADFSDASLNASDKNLRSKVAASADFFSVNTTLSNEIKSDFDTWIADQANDVFVNWNLTAQVGQSGQLQQAGGGAVRYINGKGFELNQIIAKSLIGALMTDQMLNNYLSPAVLDAGSNIADNDAGMVEEGKTYTTMEHKWDEAFGYLYGAEANPSSPVIGADSFLNT